MAVRPLVVVLFLSFAASMHGAGAQQQGSPSSLSAPGSYVLLRDGDGKLIAAAYRIGDGVKVSVRFTPNLAEDVFYIDREVLPRRLTSPNLFFIRRFAFEPDVQLDRMQIGESVVVNRRSFGPKFKDGAIRGERLAETQTIRVKLTGIAERDVGGASFKLFSYEIDDPKPPVRSRGGAARVYIAGLDFDLDAAAAGRVTKVEQGEALSSEDFHVLRLARSGIEPAAAKCIADLRNSNSYRTAAAAFRTKADGFTATSFPASGIDFILEQGFKPISTLMERTNPNLCFAKGAAKGSDPK